MSGTGRMALIYILTERFSHPLAPFGLAGDLHLEVYLSI